MSSAVTPITVATLTTAALDGGGVFDTLMRANKAHLEAEFKAGRIKGADYANVYLGSLQSVLAASVQFLLERDKSTLEAEKIKADITVIEAQKSLIDQQRLNAITENSIAEAKLLNVPKEGSLLDAQVATQTQQNLNLAAEKLRIEAQTAQVTSETTNLGKQGVVLDKQALDLEAKTSLTTQQTANLLAEASNIPKQGALIDAQKDMQVQQKLNLASEKLGIESRTALTTQQAANAVTENTVLVAQECKLRAEYDATMEQKLRTGAETTLLNQKLLTERAQTQAIGVDLDSVVGRQKKLYEAQTNGYARDAEQKAADLLVRTWATRRTTHDQTPVNNVNMLEDSSIGRAVNKLLSGVGA